MVLYLEKAYSGQATAFPLLPSLANLSLDLVVCGGFCLFVFIFFFFFLQAVNRWALLNFAGGCCMMIFVLGGDQKNPCACFWAYFGWLGFFLLGFLFWLGFGGFFGLFLDFVCINFLLFFKMGELSFLFYL